jgi:DNA-binding response OmpR family regulator
MLSQSETLPYPKASQFYQRPSILSVSPSEEDHAVLSRALNDICEVVTTHTCQEAAEFLCRENVPAIFCERDLPDGSWKYLLSYVGELKDPPALIVTSRLADEHLWAEVLNMGGYDVLAKPFREPEVRHTVEWALRMKASPAPPRVFIAGAVSY